VEHRRYLVSRSRNDSPDPTAKRNNKGRFEKDNVFVKRIGGVIPPDCERKSKSGERKEKKSKKPPKKRGRGPLEKL